MKLGSAMWTSAASSGAGVTGCSGGRVEEEEGAVCFGGGGRGRCAVRDIA